jgi:hypothetical protein
MLLDYLTTIFQLYVIDNGAKLMFTLLIDVEVHMKIDMVFG